MTEESPLVRQWILLRTLCSRHYHGEGDVRVKVWFSEVVARYVQEARWHKSQHLVQQADGSVIASFDLDHTEEIKRWILSFGRHSTALEPERLKQEIAAEVTELASLYS